MWSVYVPGTMGDTVFKVINPVHPAASRHSNRLPTQVRFLRVWYYSYNRRPSYEVQYTWKEPDGGLIGALTDTQKAEQDQHLSGGNESRRCLVLLCEGWL